MDRDDFFEPLAIVQIKYRAEDIIAHSMAQEPEPLLPIILSSISRFFKPRLLTVIIFSVFISIAGIGYYQSSIQYEMSDDYYPAFLYLWYGLAWPLFILQLAVFGEHASIPDWVGYSFIGFTTVAYSYVASCILSYAARRGRGGLKTYYNI